MVASAPQGRKVEDKRVRFKRLAEARTTTVLKKLKVLGNCANRGTYEYTSEEVRAIFKAIEDKVKEVRSKFSENASDDEFKL